MVHTDFVSPQVSVAGLRGAMVVTFANFVLQLFGFGYSYLHSCSPPVIHGNLTCDTIFIQHNGLVKIGSVAPDSIHHHVKTCGENMRNMHFIAPEYGGRFFVLCGMCLCYGSIRNVFPYVFFCV